MSSDNRQVYDMPPVVRGTTSQEITFEYKVNSVAINLTGASIKVAFRKWNGKSIVRTLAIGDGITVTNAAGGIFKIDAMILSWKPGIYYYDMDITLASGVKINYVKGKIEITENTGNDA